MFGAQYVSVKTLLLAFLMVASARVSMCELIIFKTVVYPQYNSFTVASNQVAFINLLNVNYANARATLIVNGRTNETSLRSGIENRISCALIGPAEVRFYSSCLFQYRLLTNSGNFSTTLLYPGESITINVAGHQVIGFLNPLVNILGGSSSLGVGGEFSNGTGTSRNSAPIGSELDGPLTLSVMNSSTPQQSLIYGFIYYIADASTAVPNGATIQVAPGNSQLQVEKSTDFKNWVPSFLQPIAPEQNTFYRLTVSR